MAMKTFTSLFALLSCLSVYNAQANVVTIYVDASTVNNPRYWYWGTTSDPTNFSDRPYINDLPTQEINGVTFHKLELTPDSNNKVSVKFTNGDNEGQTNEIGNLSAPNSYYYTYYGGDSFTAAIVSLGIAGDFNGWSTTTDKFTFANNSWTYTWNPQGDNHRFKIIPNGYWAGYQWDNGNARNTIIPNNWFESEGDGNFSLKSNLLDTYSQFKITATWNPSWDAVTGWTLNVEGIGSNQYTIGSTTYTIEETNNLDLSNDQPFSSTTNFTATTATYSRSTGQNHWGTLCLPFEIKNSYEGVTFYQLNSVTETSMKFTPIEGTIAAGTPVAFKLTTPGDLNINESNVTVVANPTTAGISNWTMKGTFQRKTLSGIYFIYNDEYHYGTNITLKPYRGWFETTTANGAPFRIEIEEEQSLDFVEQEDGTVMATFDLQGRKLDNARKGLVIENGKIIMIK